MQHLWFFYALGAAMLWGIGYAVTGRVLQYGIAAPFLVFIHAAIAMPMYFFLAYKMGGIRTGLQLVSDHKALFGFILLSAVATVIGNLLITQSIAEKNATLASLIEIAYPFFTFLFAWLLFREVHLNMATAVGALLVFSGVAVIYLKG